MNRLIETEVDKKNLELLTTLFNEHPKHYVKMLNNENGKYVELAKWLFEKTPNLPIEYGMTTRCRWVVEGRTDFPICPTCGKVYGIGKDVKFAEGYGRHCSVKCSENDDVVKGED